MCTSFWSRSSHDASCLLLDRSFSSMLLVVCYISVEYILLILHYISCRSSFFFVFSSFALRIFLCSFFCFLHRHRMHLCIGNMTMCILYIQSAYNLCFDCWCRGASKQPTFTLASDFIAQMRINGHYQFKIHKNCKIFIRLKVSLNSIILNCYYPCSMERAEQISYFIIKWYRIVWEIP